ncbi:hypothetical protein ERO13_A08G127400v2 [Gossypium hirsutum]|uniref:Probable membrane-associated kinase regulator 6 n=1 Tax=Gossypium hirsutum TaxID=3635 RepID=A0A1U8HP54_GOSHI|nr:probable membrane-associated kinase regulator 6 [Gossypium hirsutum]KAG4187867.1 hypothetical protein ERO13_A08G127400v2 [Gossypium hirsutum]
MIMESSQPLAIESFSSSWFSDHKTSLDGLVESPRESFGYYYGESSNRFLTDQNFNFDATAQTPEPVIIHADELFTNGFIRPIYIDPSKRDSCNTLDSISIQTPPFTSRTENPKGRSGCCFVRKYRKSTKKVLRSLFEHLRPLCHKLGCSRKSTRVDDIERRMMGRAKSWNGSPQASPQQFTPCASMGASCHLENSIYEAVLHCKRSIEK